MTQRRPVSGQATLIADRRGVALGLVVFMAIVLAIAAYAVLFTVNGVRSRTGFNERNLRARYAAEAGMVWAMQQLWTNPSWSSSPAARKGNVDLYVDGNGNGITQPPDPQDIPVDVEMVPCTPPAQCYQLKVHVNAYENY